MAQTDLQFAFTLPPLTIAQMAVAVALVRNEFGSMQDLPFDFASELVKGDGGGDTGRITFWSLTGGDIEEAAQTAADVGKALGFTHRQAVTYAITCNRAIPEAFGGGALIIDYAEGEVVGSIDADTWAKDRIRENQIGG